MGDTTSGAFRAAFGVGGIALLVLLASGCHSPHSQRNAHSGPRDPLDLSGLRAMETIDSIDARCAIPNGWDELRLHKTAIYTHQQWRSPSMHTGVGVVHVRMPLPLSSRMLVWFAKREYTKKQEDGRIIREWTDEQGRPWFEAENDKYHACGFAVTKGFEAWIVYSGYKVAHPPEPTEIAVAGRCLQTIVPIPLARGAALETSTAHAD